MGFVIMVALGLYLLISMGVVAWAVSYAKKHGKNAKRWGWGAALGMYLLVFWDWIPTVIAHKYYCATEAGFWVYKTPEQWKTENTGVMEGLVATPSKSENLGHGWTRYWVNQRLYFEVKRERNFKHAIWREDEQLVDADTHQILAKVISFSRGVGGNVFAMGGTLDEFRQAFIFGWGERNCMSDGQSLTDKFTINIQNYSTLRGGK